MIQERHLTKNERKKQRRNAIASSPSSSDKSSSHEYSYYSSSGNSGQFTIALSTSRGFVRDDRIVMSVKWRPAGIHREHVLKQSFQIFLTAPTATLRRRLRVDFMEEPGIDGGGILREWIHLICNQVFSDKLGIFQLTNSSAHQGYWISRNAGKHCRNHLQMYQFFGKLIGKALLEGLLLNVRLSIPLLKHILGAPFKLSDIRLLDETVYSSLKWILTNNNTQNLCLNFAVEEYDLIPNGSNVPLNDGNKNLYVEKVMQYYLFDSVKAEIASVMEGVRSVIPETMLHIFDYKELDLMLSGLPHIDVLDWRANSEVRMLGENVDKEIKVVEWFWEILESFNQDGRSRLLQYVTGSSGVPVEGFQGLTGMDGDIQLFTIQLANSISKVYTVLPHASTCLNRLDLPVYETKEELEEILHMIIQMDVTGFNSR
uniref:HECT-type E3 ubiquitin transferase n=1 Tax=Globisporangium ultimum (strain ATCC 200006 / CBS 805.95 / DAOM BR144) TaxID=431595 RepID=K3W795_GLOUD